MSFIPVRKELGEGTSSGKGSSHLLRPFPGKVVNPVKPLRLNYTVPRHGRMEEAGWVRTTEGRGGAGCRPEPGVRSRRQ